MVHTLVNALYGHVNKFDYGSKIIGGDMPPIFYFNLMNAIILSLFSAL